VSAIKQFDLFLKIVEDCLKEDPAMSGQQLLDRLRVDRGIMLDMQEAGGTLGTDGAAEPVAEITPNMADHQLPRSEYLEWLQTRCRTQVEGWVRLEPGVYATLDGSLLLGQIAGYWHPWRIVPDPDRPGYSKRQRLGQDAWQDSAKGAMQRVLDMAEEADLD
jgi:hypothetical protein